jgi:hypothetical protein
MALIQEEMRPAQAGPVQGQPQAQAQGQPQGEPDMQAVQQIQRLGVAMMKVVYDKKMAPQLLNMVRGSEDPVAGVVQAAMTVVQALGEKVKGIDPQAVQSILPPTLAFLFEMADAAKLLKQTPEMMGQAMQMIGQKLQGQQPAQAASPAQAGAPVQPATEPVEA